MTTRKHDKIFLSFNDAKSLLPASGTIHVLRNPDYNILAGFDFSRLLVIEKIVASKTIELAGEQAIKSGHGIVVFDDMGPLFIETDAEKLEEFLTDAN